MVEAVAKMAFETLKDLLTEEAYFLWSVDGQVDEVRRQLQIMHDFLKDADNIIDSYCYYENTVLRWVTDLRNLSVQTENVIERYAIQVTSRREGKSLKEILKRFTCILCEMLEVHKFGTDIQQIRSDMTKLTEDADHIKKLVGGSSSTSVDHNDRQTYGFEVGEHFVGMKDDLQLLESLITSDDGSNKVISICGMGGLGKTTLATKIYNREAVQRCFEVRAWICLGQQFQLETVLQQILEQFLPNEDAKKFREMERHELATTLNDVQKEKKCLVVLDDLWDINSAWNSLINKFFRIKEDRCRVLLTSRNANAVATATTEYYVHKLECLSEDEGWELLKVIALPINHSKELPKTELNLKLEEIGREMVKHCGCLPLSISVIGGILRHENTLNGWEKVRKSIDSYLQHGEGVKGNDKVKQVLYLSYKALPYNLKPCFLYLGCFPEDTEIDAEELYLLWMAGGMISSQDGGRNDTLREVAERYLCELANRCMVQVTRGESSTYNKFESCRLHDLMRDLCLLKGKKDELLEVIDTKMGRRDSFSVSWLAVHSNEAKDDINKYTKLQSLLFFSKSWTPSREWNAIDFRLLKFLKVLKLQGCKFVEGKLPMGIETLIVLKHLSVHRCNVEELPSYVCKLPCVQSLDFRPYQRVRVPNSIYMMGRLRHLLLRRNRREVIGGEKLKFDGLTELETLVGFISNIDDITHLLKLAKLRVLDGTIHDKDSLSVIVDHIYNNQNQFSKTEFTIEKGCNLINSERDGDSSSPLWKTLMCRSLSYLKIECRLNKLPSYEHGLGENLSTLYLWNCYLSENSMEMLEKLPMLRKLVLRRNSFEGMREMVCRSNGFSQLNSLDLWDLHNLVEWRVEEKAMPNLSKLEIRRCKKLEMIPEGLKSITTLKKLIIIGMPKEFNDRLKVMDGQEGEDYHKIKHIPSIEIKIK